MNRIYISGNLGRDVETRTAKSGMEVASFSVASSHFDKDKNKSTTWFNIVAFGKVAAGAASLKKGDRIFVEGRMTEEEYKGKDGEAKKAWKVIANSVSVDVIARGASGGTTTPETMDRIESKAEEILNSMPF